MLNTTGKCWKCKQAIMVTEGCYPKDMLGRYCDSCFEGVTPKTANRINTAIVVPTCRADKIIPFLLAWREYADAFYVMQDEGCVIKCEDIPNELSGMNVTWLDHAMIPAEQAHLIPKHTDCCRSFAILKAHEAGHEYIWSLDDDVLPIGTREDYERPFVDGIETDIPWNHTASMPMRGFPIEGKRNVKPMLLMGGWEGVFDWDAFSQAFMRRLGTRSKMDPSLRMQALHIVPFGQYFPMCGMNVRWHRNLTPLMYQLLMGPEYPFDRFGDIWSGIFMKRCADEYRWPVAAGGCEVRHDRASNLYKNLVKEAPGIEVNELLWQVVDDIDMTQCENSEERLVSPYQEIANVLTGDKRLHPWAEYFGKLAVAMNQWYDLTF